MSHANASSSRAREFTPLLALAASMFYVSDADGYVDEMELEMIQNVVCDPDTLSKAVDYVRENPYPAFLTRAADVLSKDQKNCILMNAIAIAYVNSVLDENEENYLRQMKRSFGVDDVEYEICLNVIRTMYDLKCFH